MNHPFFSALIATAILAPLAHAQSTVSRYSTTDPYGNRTTTIIEDSDYRSRPGDTIVGTIAKQQNGTYRSTDRNSAIYPDAPNSRRTRYYDSYAYPAYPYPAPYPYPAYGGYGYGYYPAPPIYGAPLTPTYNSAERAPWVTVLPPVYSTPPSYGYVAPAPYPYPVPYSPYPYYGSYGYGSVQSQSSQSSVILGTGGVSVSIGRQSSQTTRR